MAIEISTASRPRRASKPAAREKAAAPRVRVPVRDRMFFTERLELLLATGIPLHSSLETLAHQASSEALGDCLRALTASVEGGLSFSQALAQHPEVFPSTYVNLVGAGEQGGFLPEVLGRLRDMDERREELRSTLISAFTYPGFLVGFSVFVVVFVLVVVFPKFADIFSMIRDDLPLTTRWLMTASELLRQYWAPILLCGGLGLAGLWQMLRAGRGAATLDRWLLGMPVVRDIAVQYQLVQFMHLLSLSLGNGVPLLDALRACADGLPTERFRGFVRQLQTRVSEGRGVASGFEEASFLPALVPQMVSTAEATGNLALVTGRIAAFYERELRKRLELVAKLAEPTLLLVMGVVVGVLVASLLLPIFKLSTAVH